GVMERAAETGKMTLSGRLIRHDELVVGERPGFNLYMPVYEGRRPPATAEERSSRLIGFLFAPFYAAEFFVQGLAGQEVDYEVFDGSTPNINSLLLTSRTDFEAPSKFMKAEQLKLYERV